MGGGEVVRYMSRHAGRGVRQCGLISSVVPYMLKTDDNTSGVDQSVFDQMTEAMLADRLKFHFGYEGAPHGLFATHKKQLETDLLGFLKS